MTVDETLAQVSNNLVYSAMAVYTIALGAYAIDLAGLGEAVRARNTARRAPSAAVREGRGAVAVAAAPPSAGEPVPARRKAANIAVSLTWLALLLHTGAVAARGVSASRAPWGNMYEFALTGSAVVTAVFAAVLLRRDLRFLGAFVVGPVLLTLGLAVAVLYTESAELVPALQSYWLVIHVSVAFVSSALFTIAFSSTVLQLVQERRERRRAAGRRVEGARFLDALPPAEQLERTSYRLIAVSFPLWTFTLVAGAIWAEVAWGRYWGWDPKEVWTFVIWTVYAAYLHARATGGWGGTRAAWIALAGYACILVNFGVVNVLFPGNHSYAGIG
ncbi:c-type cytochrome biogenesis protein CcsB [Quadrisphaera sp. DSM 44207]|uniref:c-type cytochrome biogenesis protein CcsB n=1 Tax=Quadrisphaera sp. DSM 44207 TaxID=1881057 RepID=UPI000881170F|nr:c-type cytochrome biogenesis protein CcsB [Quadrisphaera sp. DSM 44207]SDQ15877.1 cytochrome c-type biogenesis protein CcsB [Quadrisphaera sp. DSM 44207]